MQAIGKLFDKAIVHYEKKEYSEAEKAVDELLEKQPQFQRGHFLKAVILEETGRKDKAEKHYESSGNRYTLWFRLASQLEGSDPQRSLKYYERVSKYDTKNNQLWFNLGCLYEKLGRQTDAKQSFARMQLLREFLSRVMIPLGFLIIMVFGSVLMVQRGDKALGIVVVASAVFCVVWLKRDGGKALQMLRKQRQFK